MAAILRWLTFSILCTSALAWQAAKASDPLAQAQMQAAGGRCAEAIDTVSKFLRGNTKAPQQAYLLLGVCHRELGRPDAAADALRTGLKAWPTEPLLERTLGELLFQRQYDSTEAGRLLEHAARLLPRDPEVKHYYAQWAYLNARHRICATQEQQALTLPGLNDIALLQMYTLLGMCDSGLENAPQARKAFEQAAAINAKQPRYDPIAGMQYVQFLTRYNEDARAAELVDEIIRRVPPFGPAHLQKAKYLDRAGNAEAAIAEARMGLSRSGNDLNAERAAHTLLARLFARLGNPEEAAKEQQWIADHPNPEAPRP